MSSIYLIYPFLITAGALFSFLLFVLSLRYQKGQLSRSIQGIALVAFSINVTTILSMYAPDPTQAAWWHGSVRLAVYPFIGPVGLFFTYSFVKQRYFDNWNRFPWRLLFLGAALFASISLTNNWHHWFFRSYTMEPLNSYIIVRTSWEPGTWFWVYSVISYLVGCGTLWVLVTWVRQNHKLPRWRGLLLLFVVLLFIGTITLDTAGVHFAPGLLITPVGFGFISFIFILGIWYLDLLDILPIARQELISYMPDPILITDENNHILDANAAGEKLIGHSLAKLREEDLLKFISPKNRERAKYALETGGGQGTGSVEVDGEMRWFDIRISSIFLENNFSAGKVIFLRDITDLRTLQERDRQRIALEERQHIARDLHDSVSQTLFSARPMSDMLIKQKENIQPDFLWKSIAHISTLVKGALGEMRVLLLELRPESLESAEMGKLLSYLTDAASSQTEAEIQLSTKFDCEMPVKVKIAFYRIAQEALNNTIKHSNASEILVDISCGDDLVQLAVQDNGRGFKLGEISGTQMGLTIMHERADEINAKLEIKTASRKGTRVTCAWKP